MGSPEQTPWLMIAILVFSILTVFVLGIWAVVHW